MPIAACYRRIKELEGLGLVYCERELPSRNGKGLQLFRSRLTSVRITLEAGNLRARVEIGPSAVLAATQSQVMEQALKLRSAFGSREEFLPPVGSAFQVAVTQSVDEVRRPRRQFD